MIELVQVMATGLADPVTSPVNQEGQDIDPVDRGIVQDIDPATDQAGLGTVIHHMDQGQYIIIITDIIVMAIATTDHTFHSA